MRFDVVGFAVFQIDAAAIGLVSGNAGSEVLVHVSDALVIRFPVFILFGIGIGIATTPEFSDELFTFFIGSQLLPGIQFIGRDDRLNISRPIRESLIGFQSNLSRLALRIGSWRRLLRKSLRNQKYQPNKDRG